MKSDLRGFYRFRDVKQEGVQLTNNYILQVASPEAYASKLMDRLLSVIQLV